MTEARDILEFGTNSAEESNKPRKYNLSENLPEFFPNQAQGYTGGGSSNDFAIAKINCTWNKSMSITYFTVADLRSLEDVPKSKVSGSCKLLATTWNEPTVDPPYHESIAGFFSANVMQRPSTIPKSTSKPVKHSKPNKVTKPSSKPPHKQAKHDSPPTAQKQSHSTNKPIRSKEPHGARKAAPSKSPLGGKPGHKVSPRRAHKLPRPDRMSQEETKQSEAVEPVPQSSADPKINKLQSKLSVIMAKDPSEWTQKEKLLMEAFMDE